MRPHLVAGRAVTSLSAQTVFFDAAQMIKGRCRYLSNRDNKRSERFPGSYRRNMQALRSLD
jgi:hypothetical protein